MQFEVKKLQELIHNNRETHAKIFSEATENYREALKRELQNKLALLSAGKPVEPHSSLIVPRCYLSSYDTVISMLDFTSDKIIELSIDQYKNYVLDEWSWKNNFIESSVAYSKSARDTIQS